MCVCVCGSQWCSEVVFFRLPLGQTNCVAVIKRCPANTGPTHAIETTGAQPGCIIRGWPAHRVDL